MPDCRPGWDSSWGHCQCRRWWRCSHCPARRRTTSTTKLCAPCPSLMNSPQSKFYVMIYTRFIEVWRSDLIFFTGHRIIWLLRTSIPASVWTAASTSSVTMETPRLNRFDNDIASILYHLNGMAQAIPTAYVLNIEEKVWYTQLNDCFTAFIGALRVEISLKAMKKISSYNGLILIKKSIDRRPKRAWWLDWWTSLSRMLHSPARCQTQNMMNISGQLNSNVMV